MSTQHHSTQHDDTQVTEEIDTTTAADDRDVPDTEVADEAEPPTTDGAKAGKEAAKYRRRLRETEGERDALAEQVDTLRRTLAEEVIVSTGRLSSAEALWAAGTRVADLLDDDGNLDRNKIEQAADAVAERFGMSRRPKPSPAQRETDHAPAGLSGSDAMVEALTSRAR